MQCKAAETLKTYLKCVDEKYLFALVSRLLNHVTVHNAEVLGGIRK